MDVKDSLEELDREIQKALKPLNSRQRKFALVVGVGESQTKAAVAANYSKNRAEQTGSRLLTNGKVKNAVQLIQYKHQLQHGIDAGIKRGMLLDIAATAKAPGDNYQPSAAVRALHELNEMDGHLKPRETRITGVNLNIGISYDVALPERVIEGDRLPLQGSNDND